MLKSVRRLAVLSSHVQNVNRNMCLSGATATSARAPIIFVHPKFCLVDEKITIRLTGLASNQIVTFVADVRENGSVFESRCVYRADDSGVVDNCTSESLDGTFKGVEQMGLFWSLKSVGARAAMRLVKKDVTRPMEFTIRVFDGNQAEAPEVLSDPLTKTVVRRTFMAPHVKRLPLRDGRFRGTVFLPEGTGPFPALIDMFGGLVSQVETRAALLASHGYATLSLAYLYSEGLPQMLMDVDIDYIQEAFEWFSRLEYIDANRLGAVGLCFGGFLALTLTSILPQIKAVVNINGISITPGEHFGKIDSLGKEWPKKEGVEITEEGLDLTPAYECKNPRAVPAWQHGAKILVVVGEDDKQVHPKWHTFFQDNIPAQFKDNLQVIRYPDTGHLIEPPHMPFIRAIEPGRKRMMTLDFMPEEFKDEKVMCGGHMVAHSHAQEDAWRRILDFLNMHLGTGSGS
ncbi:peroxisomal succinyl-coenzyme A thioesterase-like isoform X1 [Mya arenaria]|nr:peroxisomal succinyl-coenzyme A thioesterase-like isoform X1 [Mya arenaria]XP_052810041.1 peroxisomal succinyl-coenzyme A thioesterase-like isoform X1 [Mya arenaria]XP_052810042.1 peroxisomal succinyl-coenzyme A thioesterase-like isoform X1 [Mya arenaria]XP_052810043.1 peroxisomal succinyl-coenzyme A thioesterase-like isoform X1 [Mya arenaria]